MFSTFMHACMVPISFMIIGKDKMNDVISPLKMPTMYHNTLRADPCILPSTKVNSVSA